MFDVAPLVIIQRYSPVKEDQFLLPQNNEGGVSQLWNLGGDEEPSPEGRDLLHQSVSELFFLFCFCFVYGDLVSGELAVVICGVVV